MSRRGLFKGLFGVTGGVAAESYLRNAWWHGPHATVGYGSGSVWAEAQANAGKMSANITMPKAEEESYEMFDYMLMPHG